MGVMEKFGIKPSTKINERNLKILLWGDTGTRKTETVLRNFPHVLCIDTEGNAGMCVGMKEIPEFLHVETKDPRVIKEIVSAAARGEIKFPDGSPVETISIDSVTIPWEVQKEVGSKLAERRAARYNNDVSEATMTQLDWTVAKRPLKQLMTLVANSGVRYLVLIAREADLYDDKAGKKNELVKIGFRPDAIKGTEYEVNLSLRLTKENGWSYHVHKVQGGLGAIFPLGSTGRELPLEKLFAYANMMQVSPAKLDTKSEDAIAEEIAAAELAPARDFAALVAIAERKGLDRAAMGELLKSKGFTGFKAENFDAMKAILDAHEG